MAYFYLGNGNNESLRVATLIGSDNKYVVGLQKLESPRADNQTVTIRLSSELYLTVSQWELVAAPGGEFGFEFRALSNGYYAAAPVPIQPVNGFFPPISPLV